MININIVDTSLMFLDIGTNHSPLKNLVELQKKKFWKMFLKSSFLTSPKFIDSLMNRIKQRKNRNSLCSFNWQYFQFPASIDTF